MTGNVTQWIVDGFGAPGDAKRRQLGVVILCFALGCASGAIGVARVGFAALAIPTVVALFARAWAR
jgi:hypothetical protein